MYKIYYVLLLAFFLILLKHCSPNKENVKKGNPIIEKIVYNFEANVNSLYNIKKKINQSACNTETDCVLENSKCLNGLCFISNKNIPIENSINNNSPFNETSLKCDEKKGIVPILTVTKLSEKPIWVCKSLYPLYWLDNGEKVPGVCENGILNTNVFSHQPEHTDCTCPVDALLVKKFNNVPLCIRKNLIQLYMN